MLVRNHLCAIGLNCLKLETKEGCGSVAEQCCLFGGTSLPQAPLGLLLSSTNTFTSQSQVSAILDGINIIEISCVIF